jgi:proton glutamate symport protein
MSENLQNESAAESPSVVQGTRAPGKTRDAASQALTWLGVAVFALGSLVPLALAAGPHPWISAIRWLGIALFALGGRKGASLTYWILFSMLLGVEIGLDAPHFAQHLRFLSDIFLRLIKVIVAPLILGTLITGIAGHGNLKGVGRIGLKSLVFFEVVTTIALVIGVIAIDISRAGEGVVVPASASQAVAPPAHAFHWDEFLVNVFPENIAKSVADNQILQVAVFAILFGIALARVKEEKRAPILRVLESLTETMFAFTNIVMLFAPIGVGAAVAYTVGQMGIAVLLPLGKLLLTGYVALAIFLIAVLIPIARLMRVPVKPFAKAVAEPATIAFATSSSEAALPRAMEEMEAFGVPRNIVAFVIPAGYSFNLSGSSLYLALASMFVAQVAGMHLTWGEQLLMVFTLMITSKGVAGVPRAVLVVLLATAGTFHLPTEPIFMILGIDAVMDMGRTAVNVIGNCLACAVVARSEGELAVSAPK